MKILEIIQLRSAAHPLEELSKQIDDSLRETSPASAIVAIYRRAGLETDLAVHIHRSATPETGGPSELGLQLASELKAYGLVEHTVWTEDTATTKGEPQ
jgi:hypothetical protein